MPAELSNRHIPSLAYPRILGYAVSLTMYLTTAVHMTNTFKGDALKDPDVKRFYDNQNKLLTIWNVYMQILYTALGLSCDVLSLANEGKDTSLLKTLKKIRDPLFSCVIFPFAFTVSTIFWTVFSYDRSLILPPSVDKTLSWSANHVIHTAIMAVVLWEIAFRPRRGPESHVTNLLLLYGYASAYLIVLATSYINAGAWVYPILNILDGTIYLYVFLGVSMILVQTFYCLQWYLTGILWNNSDEIKKVN